MITWPIYQWTWDCDKQHENLELLVPRIQRKRKLIQVQEQHKPHKPICLQTTIFPSWIASGWDMLGPQMPLHLQHTIETCCGVQWYGHGPHIHTVSFFLVATYRQYILNQFSNLSCELNHSLFQILQHLSFLGVHIVCIIVWAVVIKVYTLSVSTRLYIRYNYIYNAYVNLTV